MAPLTSRWSMFAILLLFLSLLGCAAAQDDDGYVLAQINGQTMRVKDNRKPSLYTGDFGDCLGSSTINVTRFDAAFYKDNMTVLFHLAGDTALKNESITMYIGVYAYGESRFELTFDPCKANIWSACPVQGDKEPIEATGLIPVSPLNIAGIPDIAYEIPDFEGEAILRIFANSTQSEIGCYSALLTNGATFSQPESVGTVLGIFTLIAVFASFATAIYGDDVAEIRKHYAHSLSVLVVFAVWHHIFFTGALSVNWPSVLVAFWSNYAWAGGMIYSEAMQNTINNFIGSNKGNTSAVGAAGTGQFFPDLGGGYDIHQIYKRQAVPENTVARSFENVLAKRALTDRSEGFAWYGQPVKPGLPLPGNFSGFAGTLAEEKIPASNAFMTGFFWFLILISGVAASVLAFKLILEALSKTKLIKQDCLAFFRTHYLGYTALAVLRTLFIGFFMMVFLCLFQFTYLAAPGPVAIACVVFLIMLLGLGSLAGYACFYRIKFGNYVSEPDRMNAEKRKLLKVIPWYGLSRAAGSAPSEDKTYAGSLPWWSVHSASLEKSIHDDEDFTKKFGWLTSRFRRTRWWFFVVWLVYEFVRACFIAGAATQPMVQVFGLLAIEVIAFIGIIIMRPFEGQRLNWLVVYLLGFSKVATVALASTFHVGFNLARIPATVVGVVIIVIQGLLTFIVMVAIVSGAVSSYFSVTRKRERITPSRWNPTRERYFKHMDKRVRDAPPTPPPMPEPPKETGPYFNVNSIKRLPKVEDEDLEFVAEITGDSNASRLSLSTSQGDGVTEFPPFRSRAPSIRSNMSYSSLPYGARVHRASWSSRDFSNENFGMGPYPADRRRSRGNSLNFNPENRPGSRPLEHTIRLPSASAESTRSTTPVVSPLSGATLASSNIPSPPAHTHRRSVSARSNSMRPPLETLLSESKIATISGAVPVSQTQQH